MSRHKLVRNLDLDTELDDYDADDYEEDGDGMTDSERQQMAVALKQVRETLGDGIPGLKDSEIQESLWYYYFDAEKTVNYILNQQAKAQKAAQAKKPPVKATSIPPAQSAPKKGGAIIGQGFGCGFEFGSRTAVEQGFFLDMPWENIPMDRQTEFIPQPLPMKMGLLGGGPAEGGTKMSKLAALAKARKEKKAAEEAAAVAAAAASSPGGTKTSISLLARLSQRTASQNSVLTTSTPVCETSPILPLVTPTPSNTVNDAEPLVDTPATTPSLDQQPAAPDQIKEEAPVVDGGEALKASPSTFAQSMFGEALDINAVQDSLWANTKLFAVFTGKTAAKVGTEAFKGPSPDDIVETAQKGMGGAKAQKVPTKKSDNGVQSATDAVQSLDISSPEPPSKPREKIDVLKAYRESDEKDHINFVVVGHVDAGKSTLMGRILYDSGAVEERQLQKFKKEAEEIGKGSFALAWVLDSTQEERSRGVTIDTAVNKFETEKAAFTILDAPGHRDFVPNMIAGAARADFAVLVIDASTGAFEAGFHLKGQTKEHTLLVRSIGVQRVVVAVNKLDSVNWDEARFEEIKQQMTQFLTNAGFQMKNIAFVPCSGINGINVIKKPTAGTISWYNGPTLLEELENISKYSRAVEKPLRLTVSDIYKGGAQNHITISGRIDSGFIQEGDQLLTIPNREMVTAKTILIHDDPRSWAVAGHNVTIQLTGFDKDNLHLRTGDLLCHPKDALVPVRQFTLKLLAFETLTPMAVDIHRGQLHAPGRIAQMVQTYDKASGVVAKKKPRAIPPGTLASVKVELTAGESIPVEVGNRVVLRAQGTTVAAGVVE